MVITQPTVDDFSDTTVMRVIRKIVNYICNNLVDGINNNDIVSGQFSVQGNQLSGTLTRGDGTTIDIPAATLPSGGGGSDNPYPTAVSMALSGTTLNLSMAMSSGPPITGSVNLAPILSGYATVADVTAIKPTVTVNDSVSPPTISVTVNGTTSTANLPNGGNDEWEEIDLDNFPTDFSVGDIIAVNFSFNDDLNISSWDKNIPNFHITPLSSNVPSSYLIFRIEETYRSLNALVGISLNAGSSCVVLYSIAGIGSANEWNSGRLFNPSAIAFNGNGANNAYDTTIDRSNMKGYIKSMYRIRH